jgi:single-stranded-DNA-specific exonuclease
LNQFSPFGPENMNPVFVSENLVVKGKPELLKEQHIKFYVKQQDSHYALETIGFDMAHFYGKLQNANTFQMAYTVESNNYKGYSFLQLNVKDIKFDE